MRLRRSVLVLFVLLPAIITFPLRAAAAGWLPAGPPGAFVTALLADSKAPAVVYAGTAGSGVYRSMDGGVIWQTRSLGLSDLSITSLAAGPAAIYAGTDHSGVFVSRNGGLSWVALPKNADFVDARISSIAADPVRAGTLLVIVDEEVLGPQLLRTTDDGLHWSRRPTFAALRPAVVVADTGAPGTFYIGTPRGKGVYRSTDGGLAWTPVGPSALGAATALAVDPVKHTVYAGSLDKRLFFSTNRGATWRPAAGWPAGYGTKVLAARAGLVYAEAVAILPAHGNGFYVSTDSGATWRAGQQGLGTTGVQAVAIDPRKPRTVYAGMEAWGAFKSTDGAAHWTLASRGLHGVEVTRFVLDPSRPGTMWAATGGAGLWKTVDRGLTWRLTSAPVADVRGLALDPRQSDTVFVAGSFSLLRSLDGGAHWSALTNGLQGAFFAGPVLVDPQRPATVYAGTLLGIARSGDGGTSWTMGSGAQCTLSTAFAAAADGTVYLGGLPLPSCGADGDAKGGALATTDGGLTWQDRSNGLDELGRVVFALALDPSVAPASPPTLYAGGFELSRSTDGGATWQPAAAQPSGGLINALALGAGHPAALYAGVRGAVSASSDGGATWSLLPGQEIAGLDINDLAYDPATGTLYAATEGGLFLQVTASVP